MKNLLLFLVFSMAMLSAIAQDILLNFAGTGASTTVDSVKIKNLTKGTTMTVSGKAVFNLTTSTTGFTPAISDAKNNLSISPNPMSESSIVEFVATRKGTANFELLDMSGKKVATANFSVDAGTHSIIIKGLSRGIYLLKIYSQAYSYVGKLVSNSSFQANVAIAFLQSNTTPVQKLKSKEEIKAMPYDAGDAILFTGISGTFRTIVAGVPIASGIITFSFVPCIDADLNSYPVVQIGNQVWMAENLKTTSYNNGDPIPNLTVPSEWTGSTSGAFCNLFNDESYADIYGRLYNWYAVSDTSLVPPGWHVPTEDEWVALAYLLDGESIAGGKLKESGTTHWISPNTSGTNESGFTALPGGNCNSSGLFAGLGENAWYWSSTKTFSSGVVAVNLNSDYSNLFRFYFPETMGLSVRCIKNSDTSGTAISLIETEIAINDTLLSCYSDFNKFVEYQYLFDAVYSNKISEPSILWNDIYNHTQTPTNNKVLMLWSKSYDLIFKLNLVISSSNANIADEQTRNTINAQAKAMRSYLYDNLLTWFGPVPIDNAFSPSIIQRNTTEEVLAQIVNDATEAATILPMSWSLNDKIRITKGFAQGILARSYLNNQNLNAALNMTQQLLNSGQYALSVDTINFSEGDPEIIRGFTTSGNSEFNNYYPDGSYVSVLRLTEIYLISAEASGKLGNNAEAISKINILKARWGVPPITEITANDIFQQWNIELSLAGNSFTTIKRFGRALTDLQLQNYRLVLPIPMIVVIENPNMTQNPGY